MLQTLLASLWALATLVVYQVCSDRWEAASVRRQQLDAWAALSALAALAAILHGGASASSAAYAPQRPENPVVAPAANTRAVPIAPDAALPDGLPGAAIVISAGADGGPVQDQDLAVIPDITDRGAFAADDEVAGEALASRPTEAAVAAPASLADLPPDPGNPPARSPEPPAAADPVDLVGLAPIRPSATPTGLPIHPVIAPPVVKPISPTRVAEPTMAPPLPVPLDPTPECGDPRDLKVGLSIQEAQAERGGQLQVVRFRADLKNDSDFPIVATGMVAVAQDGRSSADQFGVERLPDVRIDALRSLVLEGRVALEKQPSPMSRSELCISFVAETCGLRSDSPLTRRCFNIGGF
ncbi:MAG: hypothetical protein IPJ58_05435 [Ardenticatenia bacterium]|nr:hypothetical protein [Ardenticatenia bacterium]HRA21726.1 hypothetical protein [Anaerolineae bacterium]